MKRYLIVRNGKRTRLIESLVRLDPNEFVIEIDIDVDTPSVEATVMQDVHTDTWPGVTPQANHYARTK